MRANLKTKGVITLLIICIILSVGTSVFAEDANYSIGMSLTSSSKLKEGDTVTVKVNLTSVNAGEGIDTITAELNYDEDVFEALTTSNMTAGADWTPSFANSTKMITLQKSSKVKAAETVLTINFKVKTAINANTTIITLKDIVASGGRIVDGGTGDISVNNTAVTISKETQTPTPTPTPTTPTLTPTPTTPTKTNTVAKDNTIIKKPTLPKTGVEQYGMIAIVVVTIIGIFSYVLYKKIAKDVK